MVGLVAVATAVSKLFDLLSKKRGDDRREDRESFQSINDRLEEENNRLRADLLEQRKRHTGELEECNRALALRREQMHALSNRLVAFQLEDDLRKHPPVPRRPDEDGDPT